VNAPRRSRFGATVVAVALLAGAALVGIDAAPAAAKVAKCPLGALAQAKKPVEITFWHSMPAANEETLKRVTDQFNSSQSAVKVTLVNQITYEDTLTKYRAGLGTGDLPDLVQMATTTALQQMVDTQSIVPAAACAKADNYNFSDHLTRVVDNLKLGGTLIAMPFNVSNPVFLYNKKAFAAAGLDPDKPPATFAEVKAAAQRLRDTHVVAKAPFGLKSAPSNLEQWLAKDGQLFVNNSNGRAKRATKVVFDTATGRKIFSWMADMVRSNLAIVNSDQGASVYDNLFGIGNGNLAMTLDTSATLGTITQVLASGQYPNVELGVGPMFSLRGGGGTAVGGGALFISNKSSPAKQAAAWRYAKFLNEPETQAEWAAGTGYIPIRKSATKLPAVQDLWARVPGYKVAYDQVVGGPNTPATAGAVIGDYFGVREVMRNAEQSMFTGGASPAKALATAAKEANRVIAEYNKRIGA